MGRTRPVVLDASALLGFLTGQPSAAAIGEALAESLVGPHAPMLLDEEALSVFRQLERAGESSKKQAEILLKEVTAFNVTFSLHTASFRPCLALRHMIHTSDAYYASLTEALGAPRLTTDQRLARGTGIATGIKIVPLSG